MSTEEQKRENATPAQTSEHGHAQVEPPQVSRGILTVVVLLVLIIAAGVAVLGITKRVNSKTTLEQYTDTNAAPTVAVVKPTLEKNAQEIVMPGNMQAYTLAPIYARTTGYVKMWSKDIGARVKKGELLALIETPELDQQLAQAKADLATAEANASLAKVTSDRYKGLIAQNAVSQQDTDNAVAALQARNTEVTSAQANVSRLEQLVSFERVEAPFDGVITVRNVDVGQLITATGSTTSIGAGVISGSKEMFDIAAVNKLRVYVNVPQIYSPDAKNGTIATLTLPQYPGKPFKGTLVRSSNAVDPTTRTLLAEVQVDNRSGELLPGSYTEVHLHTSAAAPALSIPVSALILQPDGLHVATVDGNGVAHIVRVSPGRDSGATIQILSGLDGNQSVIAIPPDSLVDGQKVRVVTPKGSGAAQ